MKVLVPLDGSRLAEVVLERTLALYPQADLHLVHVLEGQAPSKASRVIGEKYLEEQRVGLNAKGHEVRWDLEAGDPAERILIVAGEQEPDLLALATHGKGGGGGSVSKQVVRESRVPTLLINPTLDSAGAWPPERVLVPLDGSGFAERILPFARRVIPPTGVLVLAEVFEPTDASESETPASRLETTIRELKAEGHTVESRVVEGKPGEEILRLADDVDLVAMSTHGRSGVGRWWYGSVAEGVLDHCPRPLLVLRPPG